MPRSVCALLAALLCAVMPPPAVAADEIPPMVRKVKHFDMALLAPVEGVTLAQMAQASYLLFLDPKAGKAAVLARLNLTEARYDKASAVFTDRMKTDPTMTITTLFGAYFNEAAQGPYAALGRDVAISVLEDKPLRETEPMPEDAFRQIQSYYGRKAALAGGSVDKLDEVLRPYGLTFNDFNIIGAWFGRRLALQSTQAPLGEQPPPERSAQAPRQHPEWGGLWRFSWMLLEHGETEMRIARKSADICLKAGMTADTLPVMPKPPHAKCVLINHVDFYDSNIGLLVQCDHGAFGSSWTLQLDKPIVKGKSYTGTIGFSLQNEVVTGLPAPQTTVEAERIGDCR